MEEERGRNGEGTQRRRRGEEAGGGEVKEGE